MYLHSEYYQKDTRVLDELNVKPQEYVIVRYIAYDAHHDLVAHPLAEDTKRRLVTAIAKRYKVFVSLEKDNGEAFYEPYKLRISPEKMHDLMASSKFLVTEGATMASEAFVLGVPYLYLNPLRCGNIDYQCENYRERCRQTVDEDEAERLVGTLLETTADSDEAKKEVEKLTINPTKLLEWFVEHFPDSMKQDYWPTP